jgi:hypothetical protein
MSFPDSIKVGRSLIGGYFLGLLRRVSELPQKITLFKMNHIDLVFLPPPWKVPE